MTLTDYLNERQHTIEQSMRDNMGSQTMCQIHKDGRVSGGLKYDEGRLVAVRAIMRMVRDNAENLPGELAQETARWQAQLEKHQAKERPSMPWVAYSQGGLDICQEVAARLDTERTSS